MPLKLCIDEAGLCWCDRFKCDEKVISALRKIDCCNIEICCELRSFCNSLRILETKKIEKLFLAWRLDDTSGEICNEVLMNKLHELNPKNFMSLTHFTIHSADLLKLNKDTTTLLLEKLGNSLLSLQFWPSSPQGIMSLLPEKCPNLKSIRVDDLRHFETQQPFIFESTTLEELIVSYPREPHRYRGGPIHIPNLKYFSVTGCTDSIPSLISGFQIFPTELLKIELGDSSACASNEVIVAIASRFHLLECLRLTSEEIAHCISPATTQALSVGCPHLHTLDLSTALVLFDEGALEKLTGLKYLTDLYIPYDCTIISSFYSFISQFKRLNKLVFAIRSELEEQRAIQDANNLQLKYPKIKFSIDC